MNKKKQFEVFNKSCKKYIEKYGLLLEWNIDIALEDLGDGEEGTFARCVPEHRGRAARISLNSEYVTQKYQETEESIDDIARHEVCHLLISDVVCLSNDRYLTPEEVIKEAEKLTTKLTKLL